jgi:hypothetical protein
MMPRREFEAQVHAIQMEYETRRAQLESSILELDEAHAEWLALGDGPKWIRLELLASLRKQGLIDSVYSEKVKSAAGALKARWDRDAEESLRRLKEMG